eukprot:CAMPEP_0202903030 /NCGR_PEP_ID=MMETSP1392-20130828/20422_1 /ASSEMBLY_ACC=CAM_ASM_000868 /TAXON_ID=225041 /ORGANISM="Chlamydomonas chlamydogama, Strain SAG 11-48b" /LENGTH=169 /DNA_ID=CAMNT_0049589985 /DNA_START=28 /DNA_END=534 /DNA_ORIENTATION=+
MARRLYIRQRAAALLLLAALAWNPWMCNAQGVVVLEDNPTSLVCALEFLDQSEKKATTFTFQVGLVSRGVTRPLMAFGLEGVVIYPNGNASSLSLLPPGAFSGNDNAINWPSVTYKGKPVALTTGGLGVTMSNGYSAVLYFNAVQYIFATSDASINGRYLPTEGRGQCV